MHEHREPAGDLHAARSAASENGRLAVDGVEDADVRGDQLRVDRRAVALVKPEAGALKDHAGPVERFPDAVGIVERGAGAVEGGSVRANLVDEFRGLVRRPVQDAKPRASGVGQMVHEGADHAAASEDADLRALQRHAEDLQ